MAKQYKAGQIVTIGGKLYRLKNADKERFFVRCDNCAYAADSCAKEPCMSCMMCIPIHLYPMRILPKSSLG